MFYKRQKRRSEGNVKMEEETGMMHQEISNSHKKGEEAGKNSPLEPLELSAALLTPLYYTSDLQSCKIIHFCCFKPPSLSLSATTVTGNICTYFAETVDFFFYLTRNVYWSYQRCFSPTAFFSFKFVNVHCIDGLH